MRTFRPVLGFATLKKKGTGCLVQEDEVWLDADKGIFILADGFGGPGAGREAAVLACQTVHQFLFKEARDADATFPFIFRSFLSLAGNVLFNALIYANQKIMAFNQNKGVHVRGGSSVLAAFLDGDTLALAQAGVCTANLLRNGQSVSLVTPRSLAQLLDPFPEQPVGPALPGKQEQAKGQQQQGVAAAGFGAAESWLKQRKKRFYEKIPLMALGMNHDLEPEIIEYRVQSGDWLLLATQTLAGSLAGVAAPQLVVESLMLQLQMNHLKREQELGDLTASPRVGVEADDEKSFTAEGESRQTTRAGARGVTSEVGEVYNQQKAVEATLQDFLALAEKFECRSNLSLALIIL